MSWMKDFYKGTCFRGDELVESVVWDTGSADDLVLTPSTDYTADILFLVFEFHDDVDLDGGTITIEPWGNAVPPQITITSVYDILQYAEYIDDTIFGTENIHLVRIRFTPFIKIVEADGDTFSVTTDTSPLAAEWIRITVLAQQMPDADY